MEFTVTEFVEGPDQSDVFMYTQRVIVVIDLPGVEISPELFHQVLACLPKEHVTRLVLTRVFGFIPKLHKVLETKVIGLLHKSGEHQLTVKFDGQYAKTDRNMFLKKVSTLFALM